MNDWRYVLERPGAAHLWEMHCGMPVAYRVRADAGRGPAGGYRAVAAAGVPA